MRLYSSLLLRTIVKSNEQQTIAQPPAILLVFQRAPRKATRWSSPLPAFVYARFALPFRGALSHLEERSSCGS